MARYCCGGIEWDLEVDGEVVTDADLPTTVYVDVDDEGLDELDTINTVLDALSDEYGYCVVGIGSFERVIE